MSIPFAYNLRNLVVRKTTTIMTALGIALTVAVLLAILALVNGLRSTLAISGDPLHVLVLRKGSDSELVSVFMRSQFQDLKFKSGIALGRDGQPLASMEVVTIMILEVRTMRAAPTSRCVGFLPRESRCGATFIWLPGGGSSRDSAR
jgi:hypothetical protein